MAGIPDWLARWRVTNTWDEHRARGSAGGVDFGTPVGTPIYAPTAGTVDYRMFSDGSSVARVRRSDGTATEFLHGVPSGGARSVDAGDLIATSDGRRGAWGANGSTGPHIHVHDVTAAGVRVFPFSTIQSAPTRRKRDTMYTHFINDPAIAKRQVPVVYAVFTDANGQERIRVAGINEAAIAYAGGYSVPGDSLTINGLGDEAGYVYTDPKAVLVPKVATTSFALDVPALAAAIAKALPDVDPAAIAKAVVAAMPKKITGTLG